MTAKIIRLDRFNVGCRHPANGVRFPHLYRVAGFKFELVNGDLVAGVTTPVEPFYTLSGEGNFGVANPAFVPLKALDPQKDKGWVLVRHHGSEARAEAYIDCVGDSRPIAYGYSGPMLWQTDDGIFTLMHRPAMPGRPDHLIAYITRVPAEAFPDIVEDAFHIVLPDGRVTSDAELTFPSDCEILGEDGGGRMTLLSRVRAGEAVRARPSLAPPPVVAGRTGVAQRARRCPGRNALPPSG